MTCYGYESPPKSFWMALEQPRGGCLGQIVRALQAALASGSSASAVQRLPYRTRPRFMTANEAAIYNMIERASDQRVVFANVRLSDLIDVTVSRSDRSKWQSAFNRIGQRQVDFVICDRATFRPLLAVELDDSTHDKPKRAKSDELENDVLAAARLPLLRLRGRYERTQLVDQIERALSAASVPETSS